METVLKEIKVNYHSYLSDIKATIDPVITQMRSQIGQPWRSKSWAGPIKTILGYFKYARVLKGIGTTFPFLVPFVLGIFANRLWPFWVTVIGGPILLLLIYYFYVLNYRGKMVTIGHEHFHIEAYKALRPNEYEKFLAQFINKSDFTFEGLYDLVNIVFSKNDHDPSNVDYIVAYSQSQLDFLRNTIEELKGTIDEQEKAIDTLESDLVESENAIYNLVGIIKKVNENLYRYVNDRLDYSDLDFISGFSLFRKVGNKLHLIMDKGTSGKRYILDLEEDINFAAVAAANDEQEKAHFNVPYAGRNVVAFRMSMLDDEIWVWCFHFDDDDYRALSLVSANDIIESRQIRRVIHSFCLTIQKKHLISQKEAGPDAATK